MSGIGVRAASLSETPSQFVLTPKGRDVNAKSVVIDRLTGKVTIGESPSETKRDKNKRNNI
jgi:hypothetical protein